MDSIAVFLTVFFLLIGAVYGLLTGRISGSRAIPEFMAEGVRSIAPLLVLFFAVSQFLALFRWTNIATVVAVEGADFLKQLGAPTLVLFTLLIVAVALMNLLVTSGSALWALVAPALVPMLMLLGTNPATTMALYRIADSCTNSITPMSTSFMLCVGYLQTLRRKGRHRHPDLLHPAPRHDHAGGLGAAVLRLVPAGHSTRPRRARPLKPQGVF